MRFLKIAVVCAILIVGAYTLRQSYSDSPLVAEAAVASSTTVNCQNSNHIITNGTAIPRVPVIGDDQALNVDSFQCSFDAYSWNLFLALNHDAQGALAGGGASTLWESWPESSDIFLPGGAKPASVGGSFPPRDIPSECAGLGAEGMKVVRQIGKRPDVLEEFTEPFNSGPLIDANGYYSRFAISVNKPMYDYILDNELYNIAGQKAFSAAGNEVNFTCSCDASSGAGADPSCAVGGQQGAVMAKAAWKLIDASLGDDPSLYHTVDALVYTEAAKDGSAPATCEKQTVGLTGFHIAQKNHGDTQWLWSTFEHVDNVPTMGAPVTKEKYNYYIPDCTDCTEVNVPPAQPWNPHVQPVLHNMGKSQVKRAIAISGDTKAMSAQVQSDLLAGSVWANYELISTQWPTAAGAPGAKPTAANNWCTPINQADKSGNPAPAFLGNTTLETYIQGTIPQASSSCINCHLNATMTDGQFSDFTYLLERAKGPSQ